MDNKHTREPCKHCIAVERKVSSVGQGLYMMGISNKTPPARLDPHPKCRGGVGRRDRESNLVCAFTTRVGRAVTAWSAGV